MKEMKFILFTPHRKYDPLECDIVKLNIADSVDGKFSGSYGIRKGHAKAVFTLKEGVISASLNGRELFSENCSEGFATVENDEIKVIVSGIK